MQKPILTDGLFLSLSPVVNKRQTLANERLTLAPYLQGACNACKIILQFTKTF